MKKKILIYSAFGLACAIAMFEVFFTGLFDHTRGFNFVELTVAGVVGVFGFKLAQFAGRRLIEVGDGTDLWQLEIGRWIVPFLLVVIVPPLGAICVGFLFRENPTLVFIGLIWSNVVLSLSTYWVLAVRVTGNRLAHVCFATLLAWFVAMPIYFLNKQPLQLWFAAFPSSALFAIVGYLAAQGTTAIRRRAIPL